MKKISKLPAFITAIALTLSLSACSGSSGSKPVAYLENPPEGAEKDFTITYDQWYGEYRFNLLNGGYTEEDNPDVAKGYRENVLEYQVRERMILYLAKEMGITAETFTDEEVKQVNESAQRMEENARKNREDDARAELGDAFTEEELTKKSSELLDKILKECGYTTDIFTVWKTNEIIQEKFIEQASDNVTEEKINALIQENVDKAKEYYEAGNSAYEQHFTSFYIPEGSRVVQQIVVLIDQSAKNQITAYRTGGDNEMADSLLNTELEKIRPRIEEAYQKLKSGEKWETVQEQYNTDESSAGADYLVFPKSSTVSQNVTDVAMSIEKKGDFSEISQTDSGYFILLYKEDAAITDEDMESLRSQAEEYLREEEAYNKIADFQSKYTYVYDYKLLDLDDPNAETASAAS